MKQMGKICKSINVKYGVSLVLCFFCFVGSIFARTTYIASYRNQLTLIENERIDSVLNGQRELSMSSNDGLVSFTISQQIVSQDMVKSIKRARASAGWAVLAASFSSVSAGIEQGRMQTIRPVTGYEVTNYVKSQNNAQTTMAAAKNAIEQVEELKTLFVDLWIENKTDKEMMISDTDKGLVWFVLPHSVKWLPVQNNVECHFRMSYSSSLDENVKYVRVMVANSLEKYDLSLETDSFFYVRINEFNKTNLRYKPDIDKGYIQIDKMTNQKTTITESEFKEIKAYTKG